MSRNSRRVGGLSVCSRGGATVQAASFTTTCDANGCTAHWFRLSDLAENPSAPALFDYRWNGGDGPGTYWLPFTLTPTGDTAG